MNTEFSVGLLLLLVGSTTSEDKVCSNSAFDRLMTSYTAMHKTLVQQANVAGNLRSQIVTLTQTYTTLKEKNAVLISQVQGYLYFCPRPAVSPVVTSATKRYEGAKVAYTCAAGYVKCNADDVLTCQANKTWTASTCSQILGALSNPPNRRVINFGKYSTTGLPAGSRIIVKGKPTDDTVFVIDLNDKKGDAILHNSVRFNVYGTRKKIVVNRKLSGKYQREYRPILQTWPFAKNRDFTFLVKVLDTKFEVYVDNTLMFSYSNYGKKVATAMVQGDATFDSVVAIAC